MGPASPIRFDDALDRARAWLKEHGAGLGRRVLLIRDLVGRIAVLIDAKREARHAALAQELASKLGAYGADADQILLFPEDFFDAESIFSSPDARRLFSPRWGDEGPDNVFLLEREITGQDWLRHPLPAPADLAEAPRLTFFGLKGGVGRSTALILLARALARAGSRVLVLDLDLESPGLGSLLLPLDRIRKYGIVDYLIEEAVGQVDDGLLDDILVRSPLVDAPVGEILVAPAGGTHGDYLAKLGRIYQPASSPQGVLELAERIDAMITRLAHREHADIVLLDSRAGLHDVAAFTVTRLRAHALLFAVGTSQTFSGYRLLFDDWRRHPSLGELRERLHVAAALIPETGRAEYMSRFIGQSYDLFADTLYDARDPEEPEDPEDFNFDVLDESAPHFPLPFYWNRALQEFDPVRRPDPLAEDQVRIASGEFCRRAAELVGLKVEP